MPADKLCPDNFWDIQKTLIMQDFFNIVLICWIFGSGFLGLLIFALQFL